jgi:hypothetical protein
MLLLRGISRVTASVTALLLIYGIAYAMEGMTTRLHETPLHEVAFHVLYMLPWMLVFCSGIEDIERIMHKRWVFWLGSVAGIALLYWLEHYSITDRNSTKFVMPLVATMGASLPYFIRRLSFVFTVFSFAAGIAGLVVLYFEASAFLSGGSFATKFIAYLIIAFMISSVAAAILTASSLRRVTPRHS